MANKAIKILTNESFPIGRNKDNGLIVKRVIRLESRMFKITYRNENGSTKNDCNIYMFTDTNGWTFIANAYDLGFLPISYVSSESEQLRASKDFFTKVDKYLITLFGE